MSRPAVPAAGRPVAALRQKRTKSRRVWRDGVCVVYGGGFRAFRLEAVCCSGRCRAALSKARREAQVIHAYLSARAVKAAQTRRARRLVASGQMVLDGVADGR